MTSNIQAKIIADSINKYGHRLTTYRLIYPRLILSQLNTAKMLSKNTASSRAIKLSENIDRILKDPFIPDSWVKNAPGMFCADTIDDIDEVKKIWIDSSINACNYARELVKHNLHKQYANRIIEPYMFSDTILSGTDFDNFFHLRISHDAQPEIQTLAELMYDEYEKSNPTLLTYGQWHLPYIDTIFENNEIKYFVNGEQLDLDTAIKVSVSCCGQVSYRKLNTTVTKALSIYDKFVSGDKIHACYDKDTEFLTKTGWVKATEYNKNLEIAIVVPGSHEIIFEKPLQYNVYDDVKKMIHIKGQQIDSLTTFNHRHYVSRRTSNGWQPFKIEVAGDIFNNKASRKYLTSGVYKSKGVDYPIDFRLLGMYIGDGSEYRKIVKFHLRKQRKIDYLFSIDPNIRTLKSDAYVLSNECGEWLTNNCRTNKKAKKLPDNFCEMSLEQWILLKDGLLNSDGYLRRNAFTYATTSKLLAEQLQILAHIHGEHCYISHQDLANINHQRIFKLNFSPRITPEVSPNQRGRSNTYSINDVDYNDSVFCPTVSTGLVLVRRNRKIIVSGNSALEHAATPFSDEEHKLRLNFQHQARTSDIELVELDIDKLMYKRNFKGWTQYRTVVPNETFTSKFKKG
jgi:hypothetical protein